MVPFATMALPVRPSAVAPDGSDVRVLLGLRGGGMAHFELAPGRTSRAVRHRTVEEIWFLLGGHGEMWRRQGDHEEIVPIGAGTCLTIPSGTEFQFRTSGPEPVSIVAVTMPPWPGDDEAVLVDGCERWRPPSVPVTGGR